MLTVILATGHGRRFRDEGYTGTKSTLPMPDGRTLLEWQIDALKPERLLYLGRKEHQNQEFGVIYRLLKQESMRDLFHIWTYEDTQGPLDGIWQARSFLSKDEPVTVLYCDTLPLGKWTTRPDAVVPAWQDAVILGQKSDELRFTEIPNSNLKAMGFFFFGSGREMVNKMKRKPRGPENGLPDIVYAYDDWKALEVEPDVVVDLGTPLAYRMWMGEQGAPVEEWK